MVLQAFEHVDLEWMLALRPCTRGGNRCLVHYMPSSLAITVLAIITRGPRVERNRGACHLGRVEWISYRTALGRDVSVLGFQCCPCLTYTPGQQVCNVLGHIRPDDNQEIGEI